MMMTPEWAMRVLLDPAAQDKQLREQMALFFYQADLL
jgi:hypothetical protein